MIIFKHEFSVEKIRGKEKNRQSLSVYILYGERINGSNESVVLCVYFVYLSCVIVYKMLFTRWLFTELTNGRCKRFYDGELPPPTCDDGVSSSKFVNIMLHLFLYFIAFVYVLC